MEIARLHIILSTNVRYSSHRRTKFDESRRNGEKKKKEKKWLVHEVYIATFKNRVPHTTNEKATSALASMTRAILSPLYSRPGKTGLPWVRQRAEARIASVRGEFSVWELRSLGVVVWGLFAIERAQIDLSEVSQRSSESLNRVNGTTEWIDLQFCERNSENKEPSRRSVSIATFSPEVGAGHCFYSLANLVRSTHDRNSISNLI